MCISRMRCNRACWIVDSHKFPWIPGAFVVHLFFYRGILSGTGGVQVQEDNAAAVCAGQRRKDLFKETSLATRSNQSITGLSDIIQGQKTDQQLSRHWAIRTDGHPWSSQETVYVHQVYF